MSAMTSRAIRVTSTLASATELTARKTRPVDMAASAATSAPGSWKRKASTIASASSSQILSGWPRVTDSDEKIIRLATSASLVRFADPPRLECLPHRERRRGTRADHRQIGEAQRGRCQERAERRHDHRRPLQCQHATDGDQERGVVAEAAQPEALAGPARQRVQELAGAEGREGDGR